MSLSTDARSPITLEVGALAELLGGVGSAMPGPLYFVDAAGMTHALNGLAREKGRGDGAAEAFMSPVHSGSDEAGHVIGYLLPEAPAEDASLAAALVAFAARVVGRRLEETHVDAPDLPEAPDSHGERTAADALKAGLAALSFVATEQRAADVLADAAHAALSPRTTVVFAMRPDGLLEPVAMRGWAASRPNDVAPAHSGDGLVGWSAKRPVPTSVRSLALLPSAARHGAGRKCGLPAWLEPPFAIVPMRVGPEVLGLACVAGLPRHGAADVAAEAAVALERLADRAAACMTLGRMERQAEGEARFAHEMGIARQIQRSLLPQGSLAFQGLELEGECRPASQVGGDHFGFRATDGRLSATVFDVAGHGLGAALAMTIVRSTLNGEIARGGSPSEVFERANALTFEDLSESSLWATAFLGRFDRERGVLEYASAGHARPVLWSATDRRFREMPEGGRPLGMFADGTFPGGKVDFAPGDLLVLYTDGIVDAESASGERFGRQRLLSLVHRARRRSAREVLRRAWRELAAFVGGTPLRDDATLVVVRGGEAFGTVERGRSARGMRSVSVRPSHGAKSDAEARLAPQRKSV